MIYWATCKNNFLNCNRSGQLNTLTGLYSAQEEIVNAGKKLFVAAKSVVYENVKMRPSSLDCTYSRIMWTERKEKWNPVRLNQAPNGSHRNETICMLAIDSLPIIGLWRLVASLAFVVWSFHRQDKVSVLKIDELAKGAERRTTRINLCPDGIRALELLVDSTLTILGSLSLMVGPRVPSLVPYCTLYAPLAMPCPLQNMAS